MSRHIHHDTRMWVVTARDRDGHETHRMNVTAWLGLPEYDVRCAVLRSGLREGHTLDAAEADAQHARLTVARERYAAATDRWLRSCIGDRTVAHPGNLTDWTPDA